MTRAAPTIIIIRMGVTRIRPITMGAAIIIINYLTTWTKVVNQIVISLIVIFPNLNLKVSSLSPIRSRIKQWLGGTRPNLSSTHQ